MSYTPKPDMRLAVLIDADNAPRTAMRSIMDEIAVYGNATIKRIYGDWTAPNMGSWKPLLLENAITPIQQYSYTTGKNATDSAMIIDAMDILYDDRCEGFVLVSSDSDFTRLATRMREAGKLVIGMGEQKTPKPFIVACDKFVYIEVIRAQRTNPVPEMEPSPPPTTKVATPAPATAPEVPQSGARNVQGIEKLIADNVHLIADEEGYVFLGELGNVLLRQMPDFDPRNYGFSKLSHLMGSMERFELDPRKAAKGNAVHIYARDKQYK